MEKEIPFLRGKSVEEHTVKTFAHAAVEQYPCYFRNPLDGPPVRMTASDEGLTLESQLHEVSITPFLSSVFFIKRAVETFSATGICYHYFSLST